MDVKKKVVKTSAPPPPTIEYDLDTSKGLMPEIQLLIAPPVLEESVKKKKAIEKRPRRPRGAINRDTCDFCKEGGDLLCCDKCPAAFHLLCYEPPLTEDDVPTGEWICSECTAKKRNATFAAPSTHPMDILRRRASEKNHILFELPTKVARRLPSTNKKPKPRDNKNHKKSEYETRLAHLPAHLCYTCKKNSKKFALVQCDYCPLLFHLDCLDPPLTSLPVGKWMCPIHVEHRADLRLVSNLSLSTRVQLWDKFNGPVNQDAIKVKFINKVNKPHPPFRRKRYFLKRISVRIPGMVWKHYKLRSPLLPRIKDSIPGPMFDKDAASLEQPSPDWLKKLVSFQLEVIERQKEVLKSSSNKAQNESGTSEALNTASETAASTVLDDSTDSRAPTVPGTEKVSGKESDVSKLLSAIKDMGAAKASNAPDSKPVIESDETPKKPIKSVLSVADGSPHVIKIEDGKKPITTTHKPAIIKTRLIPCTTIGPVSNLMRTSTVATPTLTPPVTASAGPGQAKGKMTFPSEHMLKVFQYVSAENQSRDDILLDQMEDKLLRLCALQFLSQLPLKKEILDEDNKEAVQAPAPVPEVRARAVLVPLNGIGEPVPMPYRSLHLGLGADMDVRLEKFGHCNFVSPKHAIIFYDEYSKQYELLNYSSHGTIVDNVHYGFDVNRKKPLAPNALSNAVHRLYNNTPRLQAMAAPQVLSPKENSDGIECLCLSKIHSRLVTPVDCINWEGSALLHHGSYIRCGCLQFVFSIVEYGYQLQFAKPYPPDDF